MDLSWHLACMEATSYNVRQKALAIGSISEGVMTENEKKTVAKILNLTKKCKLHAKRQLK